MPCVLELFIWNDIIRHVMVIYLSTEYLTSKGGGPANLAII